MSLILEVDSVEDTKSAMQIETFFSVGGTPGIEEAKVTPCRSYVPCIDSTDGLHIKDEIKTEPQDGQDEIRIHHINKGPRSCVSLVSTSMSKDETGQLSGVSWHDDGVIGDHHAMEGTNEEYIKVMHLPYPSIAKDVNDSLHINEEIKTGCDQDEIRIRHINMEHRSPVSLVCAPITGQLSSASWHGDGVNGDHHAMGDMKEDVEVLYLPELPIHKDMNDRQHQSELATNGSGSSTGDNRNLQARYESHSDGKQNSSETFTRNGDIYAHIRMHTGEQTFKCTKCTASFFQKVHLADHIMTHTGEKPFKCLECPAAFTRSSDLCVHIRIHTGGNLFKCTECPAAFVRKSGLSGHIRTHTGERPFKCPECPARFAQSGNLTVHIRTHTGEKPYKCRECPARFANGGCLTVHVRTHTGEKPYKCPECPAAFSVKHHRHDHIRIHTGEKPYKCPDCEATFALKSNLSRHIRIHTGEKPFKCMECSAVFTQSNSLSSHIRVHTGETPYKCRDCLASFTRISCLTRHIKMHDDKHTH